jgi:hypothetical protein
MATSAERTDWVRIGLAVVLAGTVPAVIFNTILLITPVEVAAQPTVRSFFLLFYFILHLLPFPLGFWAGSKWPGQHSKGHSILGVSAGLIEVFTILLILSAFYAYGLRMAFEEFIAPITTAALFLGGALFADVRKRLRAHDNTRRSEVGSEQAETAQDTMAAEGDKFTITLIQSLGPAALTASATIIAAILAFMAAR